MAKDSAAPLITGTTACVVLAAGVSSRLGRPKQLLSYQGKTLLRRAAETALAADVGPVVVVTGALHAELLPELVDLPLTVARCSHWQLGMGASLKTGLAALVAASVQYQAVLVVLCDQPLLAPQVLRQLVATQFTTQKPIVAATYDAICGVPVLFANDALPLLQTLPDAAGAQFLLRQHPKWVATVPFAGGAVDVDTEAQYEALLAQDTE